VSEYGLSLVQFDYEKATLIFLGAQGIFNRLVFFPLFVFLLGSGGSTSAAHWRRQGE